MKNQLIIEIMKKSILFQNLGEYELANVLNDNYTKINNYDKDSYIFDENEKPRRLFMLLSGKIGIVKSTCSGKRIFIHQIERPGEIFGEIYLFMEKQKYEVQAEVMKKTITLEMTKNNFFQHQDNRMNQIDEKLRNNMIKIFAMKAYQLNRKVRILGCASVREKIAVYLLDGQPGSLSEILVPSREEMADYLNVTRPSLSRELIKLSKERIIDVEGRKITILNQKLLEEYL